MGKVCLRCPQSLHDGRAGNPKFASDASRPEALFLQGYRPLAHGAEHFGATLETKRKAIVKLKYPTS